MKKILFLIHDLGQGGAEKVLVNLVNHMDHSKFNITVMTLFDHGENRQFLRPEITYKSWMKHMIPGNSHFMKLFSPKQLHKMIVKEKYDIEVSYLEGPCARVISGCMDSDVKLVSWIHIEQKNEKTVVASFRNIQEAKKCYAKFDEIISVSKEVEQSFRNTLHVQGKYRVLYNTVDSKEILEKAKEKVEEIELKNTEIKIVAVGKLLKSKGFDRILRITERLLQEKYKVHVYILGSGPMKNELEKFIADKHMEQHATLLGYQLNPYKYISKCDLFVCASYAEGFSTAATEALIVGTPVVTTPVAGMEEILGKENNYGIISEMSEESLYLCIRNLLQNPKMMKHYKEKAAERGQDFSKKKTVTAVEEYLENLMEENT